MPKTTQLDPFILFDRTLACDGHRQRQTHTHTHTHTHTNNEPYLVPALAQRHASKNVVEKNLTLK